MDIDLADLPDNVEMLQRMVRTLAAERTNLTEAQAEIERLRLIVQKLQRSQFGRRAERLEDDQLQLGFEDLTADIARVEATLPSEKVKTPASRSRTDRPSLPAHLPREDMRIDLDQQTCPCCGGELHAIGETVSEMLDRVPARLRIIRICRPRYGCRACGTIHRAAAPERPIAKGLATPGLLAHVLVAKYCDHLPLYRQSQIMSRSIARPWQIGSAALAGGWSRCRPALQRMCLDRPSCLPTTRRSRCSIPAAAAPRAAVCGSMRATIVPGPGLNRRPWFISTILIARQSVLPLISRTSVVCCKSTAMLASSG
jgi:transposase